MTTGSRSGISTVKKTTLALAAPVWKSYLAIRSSNFSIKSHDDLITRRSDNAHYRGRKRAKPSVGGQDRMQRDSIWMTLATPLTTRHCDREDGTTVMKSIRQYWEQLSVSERQQILFLDEPKLVKQLYKLNLSLLCVGLMQRHLKTSNRTGMTSANENTVSAFVSNKSKTAVATDAVAVQERAATPICESIPYDSAEMTYELLEAMEFMDISTGILTVKTELAEDTDRLFTLVRDVLRGFLTSVHVLTESNFSKLFLTESETINTWANYQRLIAMLVEQLILRSYVSYLERKAAQQMEQLLLEVSLQDKKLSIDTSPSTGKTKKKKKKKRQTRREDPVVQQTDRLDPVKHQSRDDEACDQCQGKVDNSTVTSGRVDVLAMAPINIPASMLVIANSNCGSMKPTESVYETALNDIEAIPQVETFTGKVSTLNPNALVFQPHYMTTRSEYDDTQTTCVGKRKLDEYIINIPWEDVDSDLGNASDSQSIDQDLSGEEEIDSKNVRQRWRRKQRCQEEDVELEWQLQQVYASASSLFGWDFLRQCKLPDISGHLRWNKSMLWRTSPKEVVQYFSHGNSQNEYSRFHTPHFLSPAPSRYYFDPRPPTSFGSSLVHVASVPPSFDESFDFQSHMVVSSPDFSNAQYRSSNYKDEVDV